jgi:hypothetical protein
MPTAHTSSRSAVARIDNRPGLFLVQQRTGAPTEGLPPLGRTGILMKIVKVIEETGSSNEHGRDIHRDLQVLS